MEWNAKSPSQWDWEHLFLNAKATETPTSPQIDWSSETDREINVRLFYSCGGSGCSGSDIIHASSSRSSKSTSINSSSNWESKISLFNLEGSQEDSSGKNEMSKDDPTGTSPTLEPSSVSGDPLLSLKLGKRLYYEDVCPGSDTKNLSFSGVPLPSLSTGKKGKSNSQNPLPPRCQVQGCNLDLTLAKGYHRKHRVCESHSKSPKVLVNGLERRFCQQCSRFHRLSEFDDKKRSCRRRLSDHNARRRKPHPEITQLNPSAFSLSEDDGRRQMRPFRRSRAVTNFTWQDAQSSEFPQVKEFLMKPARAGANNGRVLQPYNEMPSTFTMHSNDSGGLSTSKGVAAKTINPGVDDSITSSDLNAAPDFHRALSLLSSCSWGSYETKPVSLEHSNHTTHTSMTQLTTNSIVQRLPVASPGYWETGQQSTDSRMCISYSDCDNGNRFQFQDFQLFKTPYKSGFPCNQLD
ncbi:hypothetical protein L6164_010750 [Bauhinia variegata]|uniref:Uncharacterized protein n=1 Tax=Bauhinia variegata TaxID=167791 RepID=A0ACB9P4F9_BAUVA|nr:hypothetical protein L6164_010750 [Bauhinia variegata]